MKVKVHGLPIGRRRLQGTIFFEIFSERGGGYRVHEAEVTGGKNPYVEAAALPKNQKNPKNHKILKKISKTSNPKNLINPKTPKSLCVKVSCI